MEPTPPVAKWSGWSTKAALVDSRNVETSKTPTAPSLSEIMQTGTLMQKIYLPFNSFYANSGDLNYGLIQFSNCFQ